MLVILASAADEDAPSLLPHFRRFETLLLTPADLWQSGWWLRTDVADGSAVLSGRRVAVAEIEGVITLLPVVLPQELLAIAPEDRAYVAHEMTAFLRFFLMSLRCPVLNRATAGSLCGPCMRTEAWLQVARACGIPTGSWVRSSAERHDFANESSHEFFSVTLIADSIVDDAHVDVQTAARALARAASVDMLSPRFRRTADDRVLFCGVDACPRLTGSRTAALLDDYFACQRVSA